MYQRVFFVCCLYLGITAVANADFPANASTTCQISPGEAVVSDLFDGTDIDWCRFELEAGRNHAFHIQVQGQPGQELTLRAARALIYNASGDLLRSESANTTLRNRAFYQARADGEAFIQIEGLQGGGTYRLVMSERDDIRADTGTQARSVPGGAVNAAVNGWGDNDWFQISLVEGRAYGFDIIGSDSNPDLTLNSSRLSFELHDQDGNLITPRFFPFENFTATEDLNGFLAANVFTSTTDIFTGTYRLQQSAEDEAGFGLVGALTTAPARSVEGVIQLAGDADSFGFRVAEDEQYDILIQGNGVGSLTNGHVCISLLRPNGASVTFQCSGGASAANLSFQADEPGIWYAVASSRFGATGSYRITVSPQDDYPASNSTVGRVDPGFFVNGVIQSESDNDWFRTRLEAGETARIRALTADSGLATVEVLLMEIIDPNGELVASDRNTGSAPFAEFTPQVSGDYIIRMIGYCFAFQSNCRLGTYQLSVEQGNGSVSDTNIFAATLPQARSVRLGETATFFGTILNAGGQTAERCGVALSETAEVSFSFTATNAANEVAGVANERIDIPAGQGQGFVLAITPNGPLTGESFEFSFDCANTNAAPIANAVNGFSLSADNDPLADLIMIAATPSNDGVARIPGANGTGFFSVSAINIGAEETLTFSAAASGPANLNPRICETDTTSGACLAPLSSSVTRTVANDEIVSFSVFFAGKGQIVRFDPAGTRIRFSAATGEEPRGATSVAVTTD